MLHQVDEEVGGAVEHGEQVGQLGDVLDPVRPQQLPLHIVSQDFRFFPRYYSMYYIYNGTYRTVHIFDVHSLAALCIYTEATFFLEI